jgi:hypothetical protein
MKKSTCLTDIFFPCLRLCDLFRMIPVNSHAGSEMIMELPVIR